MDTSTFHTITAAPSGGKGSPVANPVGKGNGLFAQADGANFFDLLFAGIATASSEHSQNQEHGRNNSPFETASKIDAENAAILGSEETAIETQTISSLETLAGSLSVEGTTGESDLLPGEEAIGITNAIPEDVTLPEQTTEKAESARKQFHAILDSLLQGTPKGHAPLTGKEFAPGTLKQLDDALTITIEELGLDEGKLQAAGLTPAELTSLLEDLQAEGSNNASALAALKRLVFLSGPSDETTTEENNSPTALTTGTAPIEVNTAAANSNTPSEAQQNTSAASPERGLSRAMSSLLEAQLEAGNEGKDVKGFDKALQNLQQGQNHSHGTQHNAGNSAIQHQGQSTPMSGLLSSAAWNSIFPEGTDWMMPGEGGQAVALGMNAPLGTTAQMASLLGHAPQAGQPHPATQTVAATINKAAANGETKNITIKLDPPELGRINIELEFSEHNKVKAKLIIEKGETHLMLQRDSHVLDRALQDAGLDTSDGDSLSFDLAQDGQMFDENGNGGQSGYAGNDAEGTDASAEEEIIETTMDWSIDPETGTMHYDVLV